MARCWAPGQGVGQAPHSQLIISQDRHMDTFNCPNCGKVLQVHQIGGQAWQQAMSFNFGTAEAPAEWTRTTPHREPTPAGDVIVPACQAVITGLVAGMVSGVVSVAVGWPWYVPVGAGVISLACAWLVLLTDQRSLLRVVETISNEIQAQPEQPANEIMRLVPITGHGVGAMVPQATQQKPFMVGLNDGRKIEGSKLRDMILASKLFGLGLDEWKRHGLTRAEWETARDILDQAGVATPRIRGQAGAMLKDRTTALQVLGV